MDEGIERIRTGGGIAVLPHPVRRGPTGRLEDVLPRMCGMGLQGLEVYHSDHGPRGYPPLPRPGPAFRAAGYGRLGLPRGSKPEMRLGIGYQGNLCVPRRVLEELRERTRRARLYATAARPSSS